MIKHLIILDFYAMKPLKKVILPFPIIPIVMGLVTDLGMGMMLTLTFMVFMLNIVFVITEKSNFYKLYGTLPIKQSSKILSRYLFSLITIGITAIFSFVIFIILSVIKQENINWIYGIQVLTLSIFISILFISIQYPFYFKFEYAKASIMAILPYIVCFAIGIPIINYFMKNKNFYRYIINIVNYLNSHILLYIFIIFLISFLVITVSYLFSKTIYKKEF